MIFIWISLTDVSHAAITGPAQPHSPAPYRCSNPWQAPQPAEIDVQIFH